MDPLDTHKDLIERGDSLSMDGSCQQYIKFNESDVLTMKGGVLFMNGDHEGAVKCIDMALVANPDNVEALCLKGRVFYNQDRLQDALNCFSHVLELEPNNVDALLNKANIFYYRFEKYPDTIKCCELILAVNPNDKSTIYLKTQALEKLAIQNNSAQNHGGISP